MRIISRKALRSFWERHPESEEVLTDWFQKIKNVKARSLVELRKTFPTADLIGDCLVFNVGGNKYRVVVHTDFRLQVVFIRFVMSHADYDKDKWKDDC